MAMAASTGAGGWMSYLIPVGSTMPNNDPAVLLKQTTTELQNARRSLDRAQQDAVRREEDLLVELKNHVFKGQDTQVKLKSRDLVRVRRTVARYDTAMSRIDGVLSKLPEIQAAHSTMGAMKTFNAAMTQLNKSLRVPEITKLTQSLQKQLSKFDEKSSQLDEALDEMNALDEDEEQTADQEAEKIVDELNLTRQASMKKVPVDELQALEARIKALSEGHGK